MSSLSPLSLRLDGTTLIEASAGTGKTHTITTLYLRLLLERGMTPAQILVVTYTNAATAELRGRVRSRIREAISALDSGHANDDSLLELVQQRRSLGNHEQDVRRLTEALHSFDEAAIFTIHGFCQRVLHENAFESGSAFDNELMTDVSPLVKEVVCDFWVSRLVGASELELTYLKQCRTGLSQLVKLAFRLLSHPQVTLVPAAAEVPDLTPLVDRWHAAFTPVATLWAGERDTVTALLCAGTVLKANVFKPETVRQVWIPSLSAAISRGQPLLQWGCSKFDRFTTTAIEKGTLARARGMSPQHPFFNACSRLAGAERDIAEALDRWRIGLLHELAAFLRSEMTRRKREQAVQSFDDLLQQLQQSLAGAGGAELSSAIRSRYPAALIDEFQDTDPVQYDIFRRLYLEGDGCLFLIGDPKQAIYGFRGADIYTYVRARRDAGDQPETLETNRRSDPSLLAAINTLFGNAQRQFAITEIPYRDMQPPASAQDRLQPPGSAALEFLIASADDLRDCGATTIDPCRERISAAVAADIVRLLQGDTTIEGRPVAAADIAILTRTNSQAQLMQDALRQLGVHSVLQTEESVFESSDALALQRILLAINDPADGRAIRAALITAPFGLSGSDCAALDSDEPQWDEWVNRFQEWRQRWNDHSFIAAFRALMDDREVAARLLRRPDGERRLTNLLHLAELLHAAATRERLGPLALARWLAVMRSDEVARAALAGEAVQIRLESDAAAVKLVTVHKSKGLEYPIVYCPFLWEGSLIHPGDSEFPRIRDRDDHDRLLLCLKTDGPPYDKPTAQLEALAENLRLLYVALTRARHRLALVWGKLPKLKDSALAYLLHQPAKLNPDDDVVASTWERIGQLDELGVRTDLEALAAKSAGAIQLRPLLLDSAVDYVRPSAAPPELAARAPLPLVRLELRTSSFSAMTSSAPDEPAAEGVDHDTALEAEPTAPLTHLAGEVVALHQFPAGPRAGLLIHKVLESIELNRGREQIDSVIAQQLPRYGVTAEWQEPLGQALLGLLDTPLPAGEARLQLSQLGRRNYRSEMEFILPVGKAAVRNPPQRALNPRTLAQAFAKQRSGAVPSSYVEQLRHLRFAELRGFLKGYIDLIFTHAGRWYVVDYKSNHLGAHSRDYALASLSRSMCEHHYFLQYHLYCLALHRHLRLRQPGYDYETHFGGALYLFVRGVAPSAPLGNGVFFDRPSLAMIEALERLIQ